jgi:hypothetical protein
MNYLPPTPAASDDDHQKFLARALNTSRTKSATTNATLTLEAATQRVLDGIVQLIKTESLDDLGECVLAVLTEMGLAGSIYFHKADRWFTNQGTLSDLELLLLKQSTVAYPAEFSERYLWGSTNIGAVVHGVPDAHYDMHLGLTRLLASLFSGADQKFNTLPTHNKASLHRWLTNALGQYSDGETSALADLQLHWDKLESSIEELEQRSEKHLSMLCQQLHSLAMSPTMSPADAQALWRLSDVGLAARLTLYDHCVELQTHCHHIDQMLECSGTTA